MLRLGTRAEAPRYVGINQNHTRLHECEVNGFFCPPFFCPKSRQCPWFQFFGASLAAALSELRRARKSVPTLAFFDQSRAFDQSAELFFAQLLVRAVLGEGILHDFKFHREALELHDAYVGGFVFPDLSLLESHSGCFLLFLVGGVKVYYSFSGRRDVILIDVGLRHLKP